MRTGPRTGTTRSELAVALALRRAMQLASDEGYSDIIFASDCLSLVQMMNSRSCDRFNIVAVVEDIKFVSQSFVSVVFKHVHRQANVAVHLFENCQARTSSRALGIVTRSIPWRCEMPAVLYVAGEES